MLGYILCVLKLEFIFSKRYTKRVAFQNNVIPSLSSTAFIQHVILKTLEKLLSSILKE